MLADTVRSIVTDVVAEEEKNVGTDELIDVNEVSPNSIRPQTVVISEVVLPGTAEKIDEVGAFSKRSVEEGGQSNRLLKRHKRSEYSLETRALCVRRHQNEGASYATISKELGIPLDTVRAIVRKATRTGTVVSAPRSGRPRRTTGIVDKVILEAVKTNQQCSAKSIQEELLRAYGVKLSSETVRRRVLKHTKNRMQSISSGDASEAASLLAAPEEIGAVPRAIIPDASLCDSTPFQQLLREDKHSSMDAEQGIISSVASLNPELEVKSPVVSIGQLPPSVLTVTELEEVSQEKSTMKTGQEAPSSPKRHKRTEYSIEVREQCVALHDEGQGYRRIGRALNIAHTTVRAMVEKAQRTGSVIPAKRTGRPRKTDAVVDKVILQAVKANEKSSARIIKEQLLAAFGIRVSCETIRRRVKDYNHQCMSASHSTASSDLLPHSIANTATTSQREELGVAMAPASLMTFDENGLQM